MTFSDTARNSSSVIVVSLRDASPSVAYKILTSVMIGCKMWASKYFSNFLRLPLETMQKWRRYFITKGVWVSKRGLYELKYY